MQRGWNVPVCSPCSVLVGIFSALQSQEEYFTPGAAALQSFSTTLMTLPRTSAFHTLLKCLKPWITGPCGVPERGKEAEVKGVMKIKKLNGGLIQWVWSWKTSLMDVSTVHSFWRFVRLAGCTLYSGSTQSTWDLQYRKIDHVFSLFLWVLAGIRLGGSVFINRYTSIFLVFAGREVQHVLKWTLCEFNLENSTGKFRIHQKHDTFPAPGCDIKIPLC